MESVAQLAEQRNVHPVLFVPIDYAWLDHYPFKVENPDRHRVGTPEYSCYQTSTCIIHTGAGKGSVEAARELSLS